MSAQVHKSRSATLPNVDRTRVEPQLKDLMSLFRPASLLPSWARSISTNQAGAYLSAIKGRGIEYDESRPYQAGDDIRTFDWRVTARTGKPHTKVFREERERPVFISVDYRPSMHFATRGVFKNVLAAKLAALLAWTAQRHGDRIGGQTFSEHNSRELKPINGKHGVLLLLHELVARQTLEDSNNLELQQAMARLSRHARPGSLVYIISDFRKLDEATERFLAKLARHCDVILINIFDPLERQLPGKGSYRFTDEQRDVLFDTADRNRVAHYHQRYQQHQEHLTSIAHKLGMGLLNCSTNDDIVEILQNIRR